MKHIVAALIIATAILAHGLASRYQPAVTGIGVIDTMTGIQYADDGNTLNWITGEEKERN